MHVSFTLCERFLGYGSFRVVISDNKNPLEPPVTTNDPFLPIIPCPFLRKDVLFLNGVFEK